MPARLRRLGVVSVLAFGLCGTVAAAQTNPAPAGPPRARPVAGAPPAIVLRRIPPSAPAAQTTPGGRPALAPQAASTRPGAQMVPVDEAALAALAGPAKPGVAPAVLHGVNAAVVADGKLPSGYRCASADHSGDSVSLVQAGAYYLVSFSCSGGAATGQPVHAGQPGVVSLAYRRGPKGAFAPGSGPRRLLPGDGITIGPLSRARIEAENCLAKFQAYKSGSPANRFNVKVASGYARCSTDGYVMPVALISTAPSAPLVTILETPIVRFGPYVQDMDANGVEHYWMEPVLWRKDYSTPNIAAVTSGPPSFNRIYLQAFKSTANPDPNGCKNWSQAPGGLGSVIVDTKSRPAASGEITELGLQSIANPYVTVFQFPDASINVMQTVASGAQSFKFRLAPVHHAPSGDSCAGAATAAMTVDFGLSPNQAANNEVGANVAAAAAEQTAKKLAAQKAKAAQAAFFGGQDPATRAPVTAELAGWIPPFGSPSDYGGVPTMLSWVYAEIPNAVRSTSYNLVNAMPGTDWPDEYKADWTEGCIFDPYFFVQYAQQKANPNSPWDWAKLTVNAWAGSYAMMQTLVVDGVAYAASGGSCPIDLNGDTSDASGACKAAKVGMKTGLKASMAAVGVPPDLPTSNDVISYAATYMAAGAVNGGLSAASSAGAGDAVASMPDDVRQAAVDTISKKLQKLAGGAECAQPLPAGDPPQAHGYQAVDAYTLCGVNPKSPYNFVRFDPWPIGHPDTAVAWVKLTRNPNGIALNPIVHIAVRTDYVEPPKGAVASLLAALPASGFRPFVNPPDILIDTRTIPPGGMYVPVSLPYDRDAWRFAVQKTPICGHNAFEPQCIDDNAWSGWHSMNWARNGKVSVQVTYTWTQDAQNYSASAPAKDAKGQTVQIWAQVDGGDKVTGTAATAVGPLGHTLPGRSYGIPVYKACPGFQLMPPDATTGLPTGGTTPAFDMNDL